MLGNQHLYRHLLLAPSFLARYRSLQSGANARARARARLEARGDRHGAENQPAERAGGGNDYQKWPPRRWRRALSLDLTERWSAVGVPVSLAWQAHRNRVRFGAQRDACARPRVGRPSPRQASGEDQSKGLQEAHKWRHVRRMRGPANWGHAPVLAQRQARCAMGNDVARVRGAASSSAGGQDHHR